MSNVVRLDRSPPPAPTLDRLSALTAGDMELPVTVAPTTTLTGKVAQALDEMDRIAEFVVLDGQFTDYRGAAVVGSDGSVYLGAVPPGRVRVHVGDRYCEAEGGRLPDFAKWK